MSKNPFDIQPILDAINTASEPRYPRGGFEDDDDFPEPCSHPEHNPPSHLVIPRGKRYRHVCPSCGRQMVLRGSPVHLSN